MDSRRLNGARTGGHRVTRLTPDYRGLSAASTTSSQVARATSYKRDTKPELLLRRALRRRGLQYRVDVADLPGRPDVAFPRAKVAVFCDGDFWHGHELEKRLEKLSHGHNSGYWTAKIISNVERDRRMERELRNAGWRVLRFWASVIASDPDSVAATIGAVVRPRT
jgi:DNA mismatch endonuclease, patch repair protein